MDVDLEETLQELVPPDPTVDPDEELDHTARGENVTADDSTAMGSEIDAIAHAAGLREREGKPFRGVDEVDRRDDHRWELDPASATDD